MGVTPPISTEPPKPSDVQASESELDRPLRGIELIK